MQHDFPDLAEDVPEQDLFLSSLPDMFDDYWGELEDMAVGNSEGLPAGRSPQTSAAFSGVGGNGLDSTWSAEDLQPLSTGAGPSRVSGPVITTGALPVARDQPSTFLTDFPQPEPNAWSDSLPLPVPTQQPQLQQHFPLNGVQQYASLPSQRQYQNGNGYAPAQPDQADSQVEDSDALLKQVEEILKGDKSPSVQARLRALVAAQGKKDGFAASQPLGQQPNNYFSNPAASQTNAFNTTLYPTPESYASSSAAPYQPDIASMYQRPADGQPLNLPASHLSPSHIAHPARLEASHPSGLQSIADSTQPSVMSRGVEPFAWSSGGQAALQADMLNRRAQQQQGLQHTATDPGLSQAFQSLPGHQLQLPQRLPDDQFQLPDSLLPQQRLPKAGPQPSSMPARRAEELTRQTGARSLQQQAQARLPRQTDLQQASGPRSGPYPGGDFPQALPAGGPTGSSGLSQGLYDAWGVPNGVQSQRPNLHRLSQGSNTGPDTSFPELTTPFAAAAGTQSMTQALMDPIAFDPLLPLDEPAAFQSLSAQGGSRPQATAPPAAVPAPLPAAVGRLPAYTAGPAPLPNNLAGKAAANMTMPIGMEPLPIRPAPPQRAPPPEGRLAAARNLALGAQGIPAALPAVQPQDIHPIFQGNSQESSGGSCGLAASGGYTSRFSPTTSQVAASHAAGYSHPSQLDLQPPGAPPTLRLNQNQDLAAEQPDDWAQFINMDAEADGDGQHPGEDDRDPLQTHEDGADGDNGNAENVGGRPKRKRKRDSHQQELNKQAQHRYRERKKAKAAELAQQVQLLSSKAASLQTAKVKQTRLKEHNEALRKALELKKAELSQALAAARQTSPPPEAAPADDPLTEKVSVMEQKAKSLAQQLHGKVFELDRHLKQSGLANKENVPWDGGLASSGGAPVLDVIRRLVHEIHVITHEAHKVEGADIWEVVHREVPARQCPVGCHCLHCKDKDAWLDVAESLKLTDEQKCKAMLSRDHTLHTLHQVYQKRRALNLEAITLMAPQGRGDMHGKEGLQQHFADMAFFSRARTTGRMGEVVDKLKANLREEAHANAVLDYIMFTRILSPVQSAWFITEAYPLKFDCRALASAVFQLWGHMRLAPALLPQQSQQQRQQLPSKLQSAQQQQQLPLQLRAASPARRTDPGQAGAVPHISAASTARCVDPLPATQALDAAGRQQGLMRSHPASNNLPSVQLQRHALGPQTAQQQLPQQPLQQQQHQQERLVQDLPRTAAQQLMRQQQHHQQQLQAQSMLQAPIAQRTQPAQHAQHQHPVQGLSQQLVPQHAQHPQAFQSASQISAAQRAQQLQSLQGMSQGLAGQLPPQQPPLTAALQQQQQELERRKWHQLLQQRLGMPPGGAVPAGVNIQEQLLARQNLAAVESGSSLLGRQVMGLGALNASNNMMAGAVPRPPGMPMLVP